MDVTWIISNQWTDGIMINGFFVTVVRWENRIWRRSNSIMDDVMKSKITGLL